MENKPNYQRQANFNNMNNNQNGNMNNNSVNNNPEPLKQPNMNFNSVKVGRNKTQPVRTENGGYVLPTNKVDKSFTHSITDFENITESKQEENITINRKTDRSINHKDNKKSMLMKIIIIGVIIEIIIIAIIGAYKFFNNSNEQILSCTTSIVDENNKTTIQTENLYYYNKSGNTKIKLVTKYIFNSKESFDDYKKNYNDTGIYDVSGLTYENNFNTSDLSYTYTVNYDLKKMSKDKKNKSNDDNKIEIVDENDNHLIDIEILEIESLSNKMIEQGYVCTLK